MLVTSHYGYHDVWEPFFTLFFRYWTDCPFPIYLCSDTFGDFKNERVNLLTYGRDISYSDNLLQALSQIECEWFILINEDVLLYETIDTSRYQEVIDKIITANARYLKLIATEPYAISSEFGIPFGSIPPGVNYRICSSFIMWNTSFLKSFLVSGESAWQLEIQGSVRADVFLEGFYSPTVQLKEKPLIPFVHGIIKGKWTREAQKYLSKQGMQHCMKHRKKITIYEEYVVSALYRRRLRPFYRKKVKPYTVIKIKNILRPIYKRLKKS